MTERKGGADHVIYLDPYIDEDDTVDAVLVGLGLSDGRKSGYLPVSPSEEITALLKELLGTAQLVKVCFDSKAFYHALANLGFMPEGSFFDISLAAYLMNPGQTIDGLDDVFLQVLDVYQPSMEELTERCQGYHPGRGGTPAAGRVQQDRLAQLPLLHAKLDEGLQETT